MGTVDPPSDASQGEPSGDGAPVRRGWLVGVLLALAGVLALFLAMRPSDTHVDHGDAPPSLVVEPTAPDAVLAVVRGRVLLEVPPQPRAAIVVIGATGEVTVDAAETEGDPRAEAHEDDATETDPLTAPPQEVATVAPAAGSCRIRAWQRGVVVASTVSCDGGGNFEIELAAAVVGLVAFDLEVPGRLRAVIEAPVPDGAVGRLPDVALGVGQTVAGKVTDSRGVPVGEIEISARPDPDLGEPEPWRARSDTDGEFAFDTLPPGPIALRVEAQGFAPTVLEVIAPELEVELVLDRLYEFRGEVMGPPDVLARTHVRVEGSSVWPARETALEAGAFTFAEIPEGVYALVAIAAATVPGEPEFASIPLEDVAPDGHVTLALVPAHRIAVKVVDAEGAAIVDARVTLGAAHLGLLQHHARTDTEGIAAMGPVPNGGYVVHADAEGFLAAAGVEVAVADTAPAQVVLRMARPGRIRGVVLDEDDRRVADASIEVVSDAPFSVGESSARRTVFDRAVVAQGSLGVTSGPVPEIPQASPEYAPDRRDGGGAVASDGDGAFTLTDLVPGTYTLRATHGRFAASDPVEIRVRPGAEIEGIRLRLRQGRPLTGRVVDDNARPIANAWIELDDGGVYGTDDRGVFDAGLRRGAVVLTARAPGMVAARREVEVRAVAVDVEFVLKRADAIVRGHVDDDNLRPLDGVQVTLRAASTLMPTEVTWTDARGQFEFAALPEGPVSLLFDHTGHAGVVVDAEAVARGRERVVEVVMTRGWTLVVDVRDRETGVAIPSAIVIAGDRRAKTDRGGLVEFGALGESPVDVEVSAADYGRDVFSVPRDRDRDRDGDRTLRIVELSQGGSIEGVVTDWAGDPVAGASVVIKVGDSEVAQVRCDARGRFSAGGLAQGDLVLEAYPPADREDDLAPVAQSSDVLRGRATRGIELRFDRR